MKGLALLTCLLTLMTAVFSINTASAQNPVRKYVVISQSESSVSSTVVDQILKAGGRITRNLSNMGLMAVSSDNPNFEDSVPSARGVAWDMPVKMPEMPAKIGPSLAAAGRVPGPPNTNDDDFFFDLEWGITAVDAQNAWKQGRRGAGALVAVVDSGVDATHPDLAPNVRKDLATSFAEDCDGNIENWQPEPGVYFDHGTYVAGIIAAADNSFGTIGVAPEAQIMPVAVISRCLGYSDGSWIWEGIGYAADHGADIINVSIASPEPINRHGGCNEFGCYTAKDVVNGYLAYSYAAEYANHRGATVIAAAGNNGFDFGANPDFTVWPADAVGVLAVSATGPANWGSNPNTNLDLPATYSNFGRGLITFSAPGGGDTLFNNNDTRLCVVKGFQEPCWVFDLVFSDFPGGWGWAEGTSAAAPHVAGVAALIVGAAGGRMLPGLVEAALKAWADHPNGNPGRDPFYGFGRVDATLYDPPH